MLNDQSRCFCIYSKIGCDCLTRICTLLSNRTNCVLVGGEILKKVKLFILLVSFCVLVSGCTLKTQKITIQKRIGDENVFEDYKEVTQSKQVNKAIEVIENAEWKSNNVEMKDFADYQFQFPFKNSNENKIASYLLWINPNGENLEIVTDNDRYVKLTKQDSADLYEILTGEELIE